MRIALPPVLSLGLSLLLLSAASLGLGGCGQKGPLFIPNDDSAPAAPAQAQPAISTPTSTPASPSAPAAATQPAQ
jgi:predicted small lipoprotein YifL